MWVDIRDALELIKDDKNYRCCTMSFKDDIFEGVLIKKRWYLFESVFFELDLSNDLIGMKNGVIEMAKTLEIIKKHQHLILN